jgi:iron complex transport system substrate-binding protein
MSKRGLLCLLIVCALFLGGCAASQPMQSSALTIEDMTGRTVSLAAPAQRIVALTPGDCEILYAIGAGKQIVGRGEYCDYPEEVSQIPAVQSGSDTNLEQVLALKPDLVVMSTMDQTTEQVEQMINAGVQAASTDAQNIAGTYEAIALLGTLSGHQPEAAALVEQMKADFAAVSKSQTGAGKTVYFEVSPLEWGLWAAGKNTFMDEIAGMLGLTNIFSDLDGWCEVSEEQVIQRNPDYIVTITMYYGEGVRPEEEILSRKGWEKVSAVKNGRVLNLGNNEIARPGPRLAEAAKALDAFCGQ